MLFRKLALLIILISCPLSGWSQTTGNGRVVVATSATLPPVCSRGDLATTTDTGALYECGGANNWSIVQGSTIPAGVKGEPVVYASTSGIVSSSIFFDASQFSGSSISQQINLCLGAAIAIGGTCDARALTGTHTFTNEIDVGNSFGSPVVLLLPAQMDWLAGMTDGTSCGIKQYNGSSIIGASPESGIAGSAIIEAGTGSSLASVYCTAVGSSNPYWFASGFSIKNTKSPTTSGIGFNISASTGGGVASDNTSWENIAVLDNQDTYAVEVQNTCCSAHFRAFQANGANNSIPVFFSGNNNQFSWEAGSAVHAASGQPNIFIQDASHSTVINLRDIYTETSNSDTTTCLYQIDGVRAVNIANVVFKAEVSHDLAPGVCTTSAYNTMLNVTGETFLNGGGNFQLPIVAIQNGFTGDSWSTDSNGNFGIYAALDSYFNDVVGYTLTTTQGSVSSNTNASTFLNMTGAVGGSASGATGSGKNGGAASITAGAGSNAGATSGTGGTGGGFTFTGGAGGTAAVGSTTGNGGGAKFIMGAAGGTGTAGHPGQFVIQGATVAGNTAGTQSATLDITDTWNTTGVAIADITNITNTASAAGSLLKDWQVAGTSKASIGVDGSLKVTGHMTQGAANQWAGSCAMVSGTTCTVTIGTAYTTPLCFAIQQSSGTVIAGECSVSSTTVTVTAATSNSATWGVMVVGNPN